MNVVTSLQTQDEVLAAFMHFTGCERSQAILILRETQFDLNVRKQKTR